MNKIYQVQKNKNKQTTTQTSVDIPCYDLCIYASGF